MRIPAPSTAIRWASYGALIGLTLLVAEVIEQSGQRTRTTLASPSGPASAVSAASAGAARVPEVELAQLANRARAEVNGNPFDVRLWADPESDEAGRQAPRLPPPPPVAPPLPFAFMGRLIDDSGTIVFLTKGDQNYVVRAGDVLDGAYRVEEVGDGSMTLTYLPLDSRQSLAVGRPALLGSAAAHALASIVAVPPSPAASPGALAEPARLVWIAPPQAEIGEEFTIEVGLPTGPEPRSGRVELVYDPRVLAVLGGATISGGGVTTKRAVVEVIGPGFPGAPPTPSEVRFRVLAADPTNTQIGIESLSAVAAGKPLVVASPATYRLAIVQQRDLRSKNN